MSGFKNDVVFAKNGDFTSSNNLSPSESNGLITDGELWIGTTNINVGGTHVNVGNLISPNNSISFGYSSPNITATVNTSVIRDLHTARYIVSAGGLTDGANFTTITSAYAAAVAAGGNQTVFLQPGTYTENITLVPGINLCAYGPTAAFSASTPSNVTINGKLTLTTAGTVGIYGIILKTNSDFALAVTGTLASVVYLENCFINCSNNTGISFTSSSASSLIQMNYCSGNLATTGIALFAHSGAGNIRTIHSSFGNTGASTTANTVSGTGKLFPNFTLFANPISLSSSSEMNGNFLEMSMAGLNTTAITTANTATGNLQHCTIASGTASAVNLGSGTNFQLHHCLISSSNASSITGSGTLVYTNLVFNSAFAIGSSIITNPFPGTDGWRYISTKSASASANLTFTNLGSYRVYAFVIDSLKPATNATQLQLLISADNGGTFPAATYQAGVNYSAYNSATVNNVNSVSAALLSGNSVNTQSISGTVYYTGTQGYYYGQTTYVDNGLGVQANAIAGGATNVTAGNAFRLLMSSGNLTSGTVSVYGIA